MQVSVIVPAFNANDTIAATLQSLRDQEMSEWEAIVVNDGSTDATAKIVADFVRIDSRVHVLTCTQRGVSAARNVGISATTAPWLLFLDADDLITRDHLARLLEAAAESPEYQAIYGGWARITPAGKQTVERCRSERGDLFPLFARVSAFPVHSCIVRRCPVVEVGAFDETFLTCEDWDLWQRLARAGVTFGCVPEVMALYRMRPDSLSLRPAQMLRDGLRVIETGHRADSRVANPTNGYARGLPPITLDATKLHYLCWCAGLVLGSGGDPVSLLAQVDEASEPSIDPHVMAAAIFQATPLPSCCLPKDWPLLWSSCSKALERFLVLLEERCRARSLANRTRTALEQMIASSAPGRFFIGRTYSMPLELTEWISDVRPDRHCEQVHFKLTLEGALLGYIELPICDGVIPGPVIADAVAAHYSWPILQRFLQKAVYPQLNIKYHADGISVFRDQLLLANNIADKEFIPDRIDWTLFLQEIWGRVDWPAQNFYDAALDCQPAAITRPAANNAVVELAEDLCNLEGVTEESLALKCTVGGSSIGVMHVAAQAGRVGAQQLLASFTTASGFELCRVVVREALIGCRWSETLTLRERLGAHAAESKPDETVSRRRAAILPRRSPHIAGTSVARRAALPIALSGQVAAAARATNEPGLILDPNDKVANQLIYAPDVIVDSGIKTSDGDGGENRAAYFPSRPYDRIYFETVFARTPDPWRYASAYEQRKYEQTLSLLPRRRIRHALEIGCAEGHFSAQLAVRVESLLGFDISEITLERARERCRSFANARFRRVDLVSDQLGGPYDLITCSEVLYYVGRRDVLEQVAGKLANALKRRGRLIAAHSHLVVDEPGQPGFEWNLPFGAKIIGEVLSSVLRLVAEIKTPLYRVQAFERYSRSFVFRRTQLKLSSLTTQPTPVPPAVAHQVRWQGGTPSGEMPVSETARLPILMYHRVSNDSKAGTTRWRISPAQLEEQLRYLQANGFYTPQLRDWASTVQDRKALPGRAIILTFDDGYSDFEHSARPLLEKYGFHAVIFVVADCVGKTNAWDKCYGEEIHLMDWPVLRNLTQRGFEIGSHSATHPALTATSPETIVREAVRSREVLARELGCAIDSFAYPYGDLNQVVKHLIGASGYTIALTCNGGPATYTSELLALPRIEISGDLSLAEFIATIHR